MRRFAVPLATLTLLALAVGTAKAGSLSFPIATRLAAQTAAQPYNVCYGGSGVAWYAPYNDCYGGFGVACYPPYWYRPTIVARPFCPPFWHHRIVHPPVHHHPQFRNHGPHGGMHR